MAAATVAPTAEAPPTPPQLINLQIKCRTGRVLDLLTTASALVDDVAVLVQRLCGWPTDQFLLVSADGKVILQPRRALRLYIAGGRLVRTDGRAADITAVPVDPSVTPSYWLTCRHTVYDDGLRVRRHIVGISVPPFGAVHDVRAKIRLLLGASIDVRNSTAAVELTELPSADEADATPRLLPTDNVYDASTRVLTASPRKLLTANRVYRIYIHGMNYDVLTTDIAPTVKAGSGSGSSGGDGSKGSAAAQPVMSAAAVVATASGRTAASTSPTRKAGRRTSLVGAFDTLTGAATAAAALAAEEARTAAVAAAAMAAAGVPSPSSVGGAAAGFAVDADGSMRRSMKRSATAGELLHRGRSPAPTAGAAGAASGGATAAGGLRSRPAGTTAASAASGARGRSLGLRSTIFALTAQMSGMRPDCVALPTSDSCDFWVTSPPMTVTVHYAAQDMRRIVHMPHGPPPSVYQLKRLLLSCLRTRRLRCHWCPPPARSPEALHGLTATALGMSYYRWQDEPPREARLLGLDTVAPDAGASLASAGAASAPSVAVAAAVAAAPASSSKHGYPQAKKDKPCPYGLQGTCVHLSVFEALPALVDHEDAHVHQCSVHVAPPPPPRPSTSGSRGSSTSRAPSAGSPRAAAGAAAGAGKPATSTPASAAAASFWASTTVAKPSRPDPKPIPVNAISQVRDGDTLLFTDHTLSREAAVDRRETAATRFHDGSGLADAVARFGTPVPIPPIAW